MLSVEERASIAETLLAFNKSATDNFVTRLAERVKDLNVQPPAVEIRYNHLNVTTKAVVGDASIATVASVPINFCKVGTSS